MGAALRVAWRPLQAICHGTMLEWCSIWVISTSSPAPIRARPKLDATRLIPSVVPRTKTISSLLPALRNCAMRPRARSYAKVASWDRRWTPRWMLEFSSS